eukprot:365658-Chlamydomonas_euryale.AAC.8
MAVSPSWSDCQGLVSCERALYAVGILYSRQACMIGVMLACVVQPTCLMGTICRSSEMQAGWRPAAHSQVQGGLTRPGRSECYLCGRAVLHQGPDDVRIAAERRPVQR